MNPGYFPQAATALKPQQIPMFLLFPLAFGGVGDLHTHQHIGSCVKTAIIHQLKRLCVPDCAYTKSMFINFIHISLYDISLTRNISYQTRQHSTQSVRNMPPPSPRHLLPHVLQIMPRNANYDQFQPKGHHNEENPQSMTKMPGNPKFYLFH